MMQGFRALARWPGARDAGLAFEPGVEKILEVVSCGSDHADGTADEEQEVDHGGGLVFWVREFVELGKSSIRDAVATSVVQHVRLRIGHFRTCGRVESNRGSGAHFWRAPVAERLLLW